MRIRIAALVFFLGMAIGSEVFAVSSINVPLDSWVYPALEKLDGFGLLSSDLNGSRPFTRMEVARLVNEALGAREQMSKPLSPFADYLLEKLKKEYKEELGAHGSDDGKPPSTFIKPIDEVQMRYVYVDGEPRAFINSNRGPRQYPRSSQAITATEGTPLVYNNEGVLYGDGSNFTLQFSSSFGLTDYFSGYIEPILLVRQNEGRVPDFDNVDVSALVGHLGEFDRVDLGLLRGYAKFSPSNVELEVGRDSMWWGHGRHGELFLTNNATPLDLIKLSNPTPTLLPWIFSYLGPFKYTYFLSRLEDDREVASPWLTGLRLDFKPLPTLELGFTNVFVFNGKGQPQINASTYFGSLFLYGGQSNLLNQLAGIDLRLQLPFLRNTEIYAEYGGDDSGGTEFPEEWFGFGDIGYLVGIYVPRLTDDGKTDLRLEFANNAHRVDSTPGMWYAHPIYPYTHDGLIMGHHMGPDAADFFARVTRYLKNDLVVGIDYDYMARGLTLSPTEEHVHQVGADATYYLNYFADIRVILRYAFETVDNFDIQPGINRQNHLLMATVKLEF